MTSQRQARLQLFTFLVDAQMLVAHVPQTLGEWRRVGPNRRGGGCRLRASEHRHSLQEERRCAGDWGGPYIKTIDGLDRVAAVHRRTDRDTNDFCPKPGGDKWGENLTYFGPNDFNWPVDSSGATCAHYTPTGSGNNYGRYFELPFISMLPARGRRAGSKLKAVAQFAVAVLNFTLVSRR